MRAPVPRSTTNESPFGLHMPIGQGTFTEIKYADTGIKVLRQQLLIRLQKLCDGHCCSTSSHRHAQPVSQRRL
jgi:hypothetical protein